MADNFYIVYSEIKDEYKGTNDYWNRPRTFTKSDVIWFGVDEHMAKQQFRSLARRCGKESIPHIKCLDLNELPDFMSKSSGDTLIAEINKKVVNPINSISHYWLKTRATTNSNGGVTFSIGTNPVEEARPNHYGNSCLSMCHDSKCHSGNVERESFNKVVDILIDKYMKGVNITVPLKLRVNGKDHLKVKPVEK